MLKKILAAVLVMFLLTGTGLQYTSVVSAADNTDQYIQGYKDNYPAYLKNDKVLADAFLADYNNSEAQALVARAIWYMENGYMIYGHSKYWDTGFIDCSNFVSLVYKDFGYKITSASKNYTQVGEKIAGVYSRKIPGSSKYELVGTEKLKPGDIFTFWKEDSDGSGTHIGHVALYMGEINGQPAVIQTDSNRPTAIGIRTDFRYWYGEHFSAARRVLDDDSQLPGKSWQASAPVIPAVYQLPPQKPVILPGEKFMNYEPVADVEDTPDEGNASNSVDSSNAGSSSSSGDSSIAGSSSNSVDSSNAGSSSSSGDSSNAGHSSDTEGSSALINTTDNKNNNNSAAVIADILPFSDVSGNWAENNIRQLQKAGCISGYPDGTFHPDNIINRAEFAAILVNSLKLSPKAGKVFSDTANHWARNYIATAEGYGFVSGYNGALFGPDDPVTREQMAVMVVKAAQLDTNTTVNITDVFTDGSKISDWSQNAVIAADQANIICGYPDVTFRSQAYASRAEAITVIINTLKLKGCL